MSPSLNSHYSLLLGLESPRKVAKVNLEMVQHRVVIDVVHGPGKVVCPDCEKLSPQRDLAPVRSWRHLDTMNFETIIRASVPRCNCPDCGVKTVAIPWAGKHSRFTLMFEAFDIEVLRMAGSLDAGRVFLGLSWDSAHAIMERAVERGLARRDISGAEHIGIDEKSFLRGHNYLTALNDLDEGGVLDVVQERTEAACRKLIDKALPGYCRRFKIKAVAVAVAVCAWAIKESFTSFWQARNRVFAELVFDDWYNWAVRRQLKPVVKVAKMLKKHLEGLLTYFQYPITNAVSEGLNSKIQSIKAAARGFRNFGNYRIRILFTCGKLDLTPEVTQ